MNSKQSEMKKEVEGIGRLVEDPDNSVELSFHDKETKKPKASMFVDVADSNGKKIRGLSERKSMDDRVGMFFPNSRSFWMPPEMNMDLDLVFMNKKGEVTEIIDMPRDNGRSTYMPKQASSVHAIEFNRGACKKFGINVGDRAIPKKISG